MNVPAYLPITPAKPVDPSRRRDRRDRSVSSSAAAADRVELSGKTNGPTVLTAKLFHGHDPRTALAAEFIKIHRREFKPSR